MHFQKRWVRILISLLVSGLLWYSVKLVNTYKATIIVPIGYTNYPNHLKLTKPLRLNLELEVSGKGHELLLPYFISNIDTTYIDLEPYYYKKEIITSQLAAAITANLPPSLKIERIVPEAIPLAFERKLTKKVPIVPNVKIIQEEGYLPVTPLKLIPDSVLLIGTDQDILPYSSWMTEFKVIRTNQPENKVDLLEPENLTLSPNKVDLSFQVKRFTEYTSTASIRIKNLPSHLRLRLLPEKVAIKYLLPLEIKENLEEERAFEIEVDFRQTQRFTNYLTPIISKSPKGVRGVRLEPPYIYYIVSQK
jgi:hypothetical protein